MSENTPQEKEQDVSSLLHDFDAETKRRAKESLDAFNTLKATNKLLEDIATIEVDYDGYGDSGSVEAIRFIKSDKSEVKIEDKTINDTVETFAMNQLDVFAGGWENNEGAYGMVAIDVQTSKGSIDHNWRVESTENQGFEF